MSTALTNLELRHPGGVTEVVAGRGALDASREWLLEWVEGRMVFGLTDFTVLEIHGQRLEFLGGPDSPARRYKMLQMPPGEEHKTVESAAILWEIMLEAGGKRDSRFITLGGGCVGDLGGFMAGCFLRGIPFVNVPTTLLGQVDASIGGKTGVDLPKGKNTVGLFHHPERVVLDPVFLTTLPKAELRSGLVEVVKMAYLLDLDLLERVEKDLDRLLEADEGALAPVVAAAAAAKIGVVERDPTEKGERKLLNFGHTLGHAIEAELGYQDLRHGEAVAYGLLFALKLSEERGLDPSAADRLRRILARLDPPKLPKDLRAGPLVDHMERDKKARETGLSWVLAAEPGRGEIVDDVDLVDVYLELSEFLEDPWA